LDIDAVKSLLKCGANANKTIYKRHILTMAMDKRAYSLAYLLLDNGASINGNGAFDVACNDPDIDIEIIKELLDRGADIGPTSEAIYNASRTHRYDIVSLLMDRGADVTARVGMFNRSALMVLMDDRSEGRIDTNALARQLLKNE
jgi:ankyrin repeat protein